MGYHQTTEKYVNRLFLAIRCMATVQSRGSLIKVSTVCQSTKYFVKQKHNKLKKIGRKIQTFKTVTILRAKKLFLHTLLDSMSSRLVIIKFHNIKKRLCFR